MSREITSAARVRSNARADEPQIDCEVASNFDIELADLEMRMDALRKAGVQFLIEMFGRMEADAQAEFFGFTHSAIDRLGIDHFTVESSRVWCDALLSCLFGGQLTATVALEFADNIAILAVASPNDPAAIAARLNALSNQLTDEERKEITIQIVPRWSHERPGIVSPLALHDNSDSAQSSTGALGAGATPDGGRPDG